MILLGGPLPQKAEDPGHWVRMMKDAGYRAERTPVGIGTPPEVVADYARAARENGLVIAEVGAWSNPLAADAEERRKAREKCVASLALAEEIGARCCVNITGARGPVWDGPYAQNLTPQTFDMIVESVRAIIDAVNPRRTFYVLETMPWMYPDSADSYLRLLAAIDRPAAGVHFDPVNLVNSPARYFDNAALMRDFVEKLGDRIKSCHAKDTLIETKLTVRLNEVRPGTGNLDYAAYLQALDRLPGDVPLLLEHLSTMEEYAQAAEYIRSVAKQERIAL